MSDHYSSHGNDLLPNWLLPDVRKNRATHGDYLMFSSMATCDVADNRRRDAWRILLAPCKKATKGWKLGVGTQRWCRSPMPMRSAISSPSTALGGLDIGYVDGAGCHIQCSG